MSKEVEAKYLNYYRCPRCGYEWEDEWDCQVDDDCPECDKRHITPYKSEDIETGEDSGQDRESYTDDQDRKTYTTGGDE